MTAAAYLRLTSEQRKEAIVAAAIPLFAEKGFNGTTTRELAEAAGVSEALLYKHFPSKKELFREMHSRCCRTVDTVAQNLSEMDNGTEALVMSFYFMMCQIILGDRSGQEDPRAVGKLMLHSMLEDGEFAREILGSRVLPWLDGIECSIRDAIRAGDVLDVGINGQMKIWFIHHFAVGLKVFRIPEEKVVDYPVEDDIFFEQAMQFCLRGIGMKQEAIEKYLDRGLLDKKIDQMFRK